MEHPERTRRAVGAITTSKPLGMGWILRSNAPSGKLAGVTALNTKLSAAQQKADVRLKVPKEGFCSMR